MKFNLFYLFLTISLITACQKEATKSSLLTTDTTLQSLVVINEEDKDEEGKNKEDKGKKDCFELVYPLSITMPDDSVLSGGKEDLWTAVKTWYEVNSTSEEKPTLNYPVEVIWKGGEQKTINNETEMAVAKKYCDTDKKGCFGLIYPVSWTLPDGSTADMNDKNDWTAVKAWYEANPTSEEKPSLNYPVEILFKDGSTQTIGDDVEMEDAKKGC